MNSSQKLQNIAQQLREIADGIDTLFKSCSGTYTEDGMQLKEEIDPMIVLMNILSQNIISDDSLNRSKFCALSSLIAAQFELNADYALIEQLKSITPLLQGENVHKISNFICKCAQRQEFSRCGAIQQFVDHLIEEQLSNDQLNNFSILESVIQSGFIPDSCCKLVPYLQLQEEQGNLQASELIVKLTFQKEHQTTRISNEVQQLNTIKAQKTLDNETKLEEKQEQSQQIKAVFQANVLNHKQFSSEQNLLFGTCKPNSTLIILASPQKFIKICLQISTQVTQPSKTEIKKGIKPKIEQLRSIRIGFSAIECDFVINYLLGHASSTIALVQQDGLLMIEANQKVIHTFQQNTIQDKDRTEFGSLEGSNVSSSSRSRAQPVYRRQLTSEQIEYDEQSLSNSETESDDGYIIEYDNKQKKVKYSQQRLSQLKQQHSNFNYQIIRDSIVQIFIIERGIEKLALFKLGQQIIPFSITSIPQQAQLGVSGLDQGTTYRRVSVVHLPISGSTFRVMNQFANSERCIKIPFPTK
ncbi:MAG: hypothetical protein EZS28_013131 [Streblomastix strix]|uniref:Uncharacterized protein n=1 Tax=Streblomastix strix TaxID=222440 RepID=A0A5J4W9Z0_9EUKA|nr:MAG: hypothetical protein EZS28_013131 [Streblomastix strix]